MDLSWLLEQLTFTGGFMTWRFSSSLGPTTNTGWSGGHFLAWADFCRFFPAFLGFTAAGLKVDMTGVYKDSVHFSRLCFFSLS